MNKISIVLADDHRIFRYGVKKILERELDIEIVGEAETIDDAYEKCKMLNPDLVLVDINFPNSCGLKLAKQVSDELRTKILALTSFDENKYVVEMLRAGASGYLVKNSSPAELVRAIKTIHGGHSYFSQNLSKTIFENANKEKILQSKIENFPVTSRELEVLKHISEEMTNKEIAQQLYISPRTVETHKRNLMQKLKVKNVVGLAKFYFKLTYNLEPNSTSEF